MISQLFLARAYLHHQPDVADPVLEVGYVPIADIGPRGLDGTLFGCRHVSTEHLICLAVDVPYNIRTVVFGLAPNAVIYRLPTKSPNTSFVNSSDDSSANDRAGHRCISKALDHFGLNSRLRSIAYSVGNIIARKDRANLPAIGAP